ncbi:MAG: hypothetical protein PHE88_06235 [Elusimicrobia bacterium]|nr:hypothetical protein [Elusimicrobiota bacterium]
MAKKKIKKSEKTEKSQKYKCSECGKVVSVDECGCSDCCDLVCCGEPMVAC